MAQNTTERVLFELIKAGLWEKGILLQSYGNLDYEEVMHLAEEQSVVGLVTAGLDHVQGVKVPQELLLQFIGQSLQLEQQNKDINDFVAKLISKLRKEDVYVILVKGQGVAQCYEKPLWRACGDVDLFLSEDNYAKAKNLLLPLATKVEQEYLGFKHLGMTIDGWVVELHGSLYVELSNKVNHVLDEIKNDTFYGGNVRSWDNSGAQIFLLDKENDIFYVFAHFLNHFYVGGIGLRQICDWCRLLWTYRNSLDRELLEHRIKKAGLMVEWRAFGAFAVEYLGMPIEAMPLLDVRSQMEDGRSVIDKRLRRKAERIKDFIMMSGNFGHNRDMSYYSKYPFVIRKCCSMWMRVTDLYNHARIFPLDSLRFFPRIMWNGMRSAVRGEG
jgi:hypothetical protein